MGGDHVARHGASSSDGKKWLEGVSPETRAWAGPRAALRSGVGTIQTVRTAFQLRVRPSGAAAARVFRADAAERPERRTNRSELQGFFSSGDGSTGAVLGRIDRSGRRPGCGGDGASWTRARFSGGAGERPRGRTMSSAASAGVFSGGWVWGFRWRWAAAPRRGLCPDVPRLSVPRGINRVALCGAAIAVDGQKRGRDEKMTAPPPRPSPKGAGVRGRAALRVGTLQAFPRLPRLGQSPRVTSNPVLSGGGKPLCDYVKSTPPL